MLKCSSCLGLSVIFKYFVSAFPTSICICLSSVHWARWLKAHIPLLSNLWLCMLCAAFYLVVRWGRTSVEQSLYWKTERIAGVSSALTKRSASHFPQLTGPYRESEQRIFLFLCVYPLKNVSLLCWGLALWLSTCLTHKRPSILSRSNCFFSLSVVSTFA